MEAESKEDNRKEFCPGKRENNAFSSVMVQRKQGGKIETESKEDNRMKLCPIKKEKIMH